MKKITTVAVFTVIFSYFSLAQSNQDSLSSTDLLLQQSVSEVTSSEESQGRNHLLGEIGGLRNQLLDYGLDVQILLKAEAMGNLYQGNNHYIHTISHLDIISNLDLKKSFGLDNTYLTSHLLFNSGGFPNNTCLSSQGVSNIETAPVSTIYQLYLEKNFWADRFSVLFGLFDLNSEFDVQEASTIFINPSHGIGAEFSKSGINGPSIFPYTSLALRVKYLFGGNNLLKFGIFDALPSVPNNFLDLRLSHNKDEGYLIAAEYKYAKDEIESNGDKFIIGSWFYTSESNKLFNYSNSSQKNFGFYSSYEKLLYSVSTRDVLSFFRVGYANRNVCPVDYYLGFGFTFRGMLKNRENDIIGISLAHAHKSDSFRKFLLDSENITIKEAESNIELTYVLQLTPYIKIQPDIQILINPVFSNRTLVSVVATRLELIF
jgi:porin